MGNFVNLFGSTVNFDSDWTMSVLIELALCKFPNRVTVVLNAVLLLPANWRLKTMVQSVSDTISVAICWLDTVHATRTPSTIGGLSPPQPQH